MYAQPVFREADESILLDAVTAMGAGTLVTQSGTELLASFVPVLVADRGPGGVRLVAHVARANPQWRTTDTDLPFLFTATGPHGYISPTWYPTKQETGEVVPTWDYVHVQVRGRISFTEDRDEKLAIVSALTGHHEAEREEPWKVSDGPDPFVDRMLRAIVGIHLDLASIEGSWKLSQNRPEADREGVVQALQPSAPDLADRIQTGRRP